MSRLIKYRVRNKKTLEIFDTYDFALLGSGDVLTPGGDECNDEVYIEQYTGINDKNGIEICEGDEFIDEEHQHGKVFFDNKKACFMVAIQEYTYDEHGSTITYTAPLFEALDCGAEISVIIKNPELLEDK